MKIIHIVLGKADPERMNGVNKVVHSLASHQVMAGADVEVWGITTTPEVQVNDRSYVVKLFKSHRNKFAIDRMLKKALLALDRTCVIHFHAGFILEFQRIAALLYDLDIPYVVTPHGNYMNGAMEKNKWVKTIYFQMFEKMMLKKALFIHCIGLGEIEDLKTLGNFNNIHFIPNGQEIHPQELYAQGKPKNEMPVMGFCGRVTRHQKGLDLLLEGFLQYKTNHKGLGRLWIVGDGEYMEEMKVFVHRHRLENDVELYGSRFGEEKLQIMAKMDAFYHPSRNEGMPMAVLEAATLGKTLVVSKYTNMTSFVADYEAGICLVENTPEEIAMSMQMVEELYQKDALSITGNNARRMAEENFDWKEIALKMIDAYATYFATTSTQ